MQQPEQFDGLHVPPEQTPFMQVWPALQLRHCEPFAPQALVALPVTHWPVASQQPAQLAAEQTRQSGAFDGYG